MGGNGLFTKETERRIGGNGLFIQRHRRGGWEVTDRLYKAVGKYSIDFFGKLYRLSGKTL